MAISDEEQKLRDETRSALLAAIKDGAEKIHRATQPHAEGLRNLAEAYALVTDEGDKDGADAGGTF